MFDDDEDIEDKVNERILAAAPEKEIFKKALGALVNLGNYKVDFGPDGIDYFSLG
jgi:hypothetical protein